MMPTSSITSTKSDDPSSIASSRLCEVRSVASTLILPMCDEMIPAIARTNATSGSSHRRGAWSTATASTPSKCPPAPSGTIMADRGALGSLRHGTEYAASESTMSSMISGSRSGSLSSISTNVSRGAAPSGDPLVRGQRDLRRSSPRSNVANVTASAPSSSPIWRRWTSSPSAMDPGSSASAHSATSICTRS